MKNSVYNLMGCVAYLTFSMSAAFEMVGQKQECLNEFTVQDALIFLFFIIVTMAVGAISVISIKDLTDND